MKRFFIILLALVLAACGAPPPAAEQPTAAPPEPTQTAVVVVETVVVTVIPTNAPTDAPAATPLPPPTDVSAPTEAPAPTAAVVADTSGGLVAAEDVLGAGWFVSMTRTRNDFALRCQLSKEVTFSVTPTDPNITEVQFFYRIEDRVTGAVFDWQNAGRMLPDANGNFALVFSGENVHANFRKPNAWFDYQFVGLSRSGGVVGRSEKIVQQVSYSLDCP